MRTRKSAEERKSEIVEATLRLADKVGPDRLSTEQVAKAIGITQAAIFRHFPRKQDLWQAVASRVGERFRSRWLALEAEDRAPTARIRALVRAQLETIRATPAIPAILLSRELHVENPVLRGIFRELMEQYHRRIARLIEAGQETGELRAHLDADDAAFLVIGLVQGLVLRWSLSGRAFDLGEEGARLLEVLLTSLAPAPERPRGDRR